MKLYEDEILVSCTFGEVTSSNGRLAVDLTSEAWVITTSWPLWAIRINENLNLN